MLTAVLILGPVAVAQVVGSDGKVQPALVEESSLLANADLAAETTQGIVFRGRNTASIGRFRVEAGRHTFCVSGGGSGVSGLDVQGPAGRMSTQLLDRQGCVRVKVKAGVVSLRLRRSTAPTVPWVTAVLRADPPSWPNPAPLVLKNGSPAEGYWAIQDTTYNGRGTIGNRVLSWQLGATPGLSVDANISFDGNSLLQLPTSTPGNQIPARLASTGDRWSLYIGNPYVTNPCDGYCEDAYGTSDGELPVGITVQDLGSYAFQFYINQSLPNWLFGAQSGDQTLLNATFNQSQSDNFQVLFRFIPAGATYKHGPRGGEVALYQGCNFSGNLAIFEPLMGPGIVSPGYDLTALSSSATTLDGTASAVSVSPGHSLYWGPDASNPQGGVVEDTSCLTGSKPTGQLFVEPLANTLVVAHDLLHKSCLNCVMDRQNLALTAGTDSANFSGWNFGGATFHKSALSGLNLSGGTFTGSAFAGATLTDVDLSHINTSGPLDFTGATLTRVKFAGTDISGFKFAGATLSQVDFSGTTNPAGTLDFTGATLTQVNLNGINPTTLVMPNAKLCGVSLTGSDTNHRLDLTSGNFAGTQVTLSSDCAANLSFTKLKASATNATSWAGLNLTGAVVHGLAGVVLSSQSAPLNLAGATLTHASIEGVILDYATNLAGTNLSGIDLSHASLRWTNLSGAELYSANLIGANLERANMNGVFLTKDPNGSEGAANLEGAFLRGVNLSGAHLSGADFTNANFYGEVAVGTGVCTPESTGFTNGCATASSATMDETVFGNAYLFGVDFTYAKAQGVNFGGSFLVGANFSGATLTGDPAGTDPGFSGAFLQGTDFSSTIIKNNVSFNNAFVDFSPNGNTVFTELTGYHTTFADYWNQAEIGKPVCAQMTYSYPTMPPANTQGITCPDGSNNGCGFPAPDGSNLRWKSLVYFPSQGSYLNNSTYWPAPASPLCEADLKWIPIGNTGRRPAPHPSPKPFPQPDPGPKPRRP